MEKKNKMEERVSDVEDWFHWVCFITYRVLQLKHEIVMMIVVNVTMKTTSITLTMMTIKGLI